MNQAADQCPPADVIAAFALGELQAANADRVRAHLSVCDSCLQTVGHIARASGTSSIQLGGGALTESGQIIGPYRLVRHLGDGGMGEVWEAEQSAPVYRVVALKLLKAGMDTRQVVARFSAERQVLALMQHPCIAQVFDAGVTPGGRPYFVMEYVDGTRITEYCDRAQLDVHERLLLFQQVCEAVQHAHQKGVIHRDIKPSNVMVTAQNGKPLPKVIDFGLAKLTAAQLKDATLTELGMVLGTPAYASPEQMTLGAMDVDTRSDVYSLGVLLYELLVGVIPFEPQSARADVPVRPSVRVLALGDGAAEVARYRRTDARTLRRQLRGDLDWIVLKALEKDRARRYVSPGELAGDIRRYLENEPVLAGPPTAAYRLGKFVRRHRAATAFATIILSLLIAFAAVSAMQLKRIAAERDRASAAANKAASINSFLQETLGSADPWRTGSDISVRETLQRAADQVETSFKDQPLIGAAIRHTLAKTYIGLGRLDGAEHEIRAALATRSGLLGHESVDVAESLADLASLYQARADYEAADKASREALDLRRRLLGNNHPVVAESLFDRAVLLKAKGDYQGAHDAAAEALAIRERLYGENSNEVAEALQQLGLIAASGAGDMVGGEQLVRRGYEIQRRLFGPDDLRTAESASNVGSVALYAGKNEQAEAFYRIAMVGELRHLGKNHPDTLAAAENLANALARLRRFDESSALMKDVLAGRRAVLGEDNRLVARTRLNIAILLSRSGRLAEAQNAYAQALPGFVRAYGPEHPDTAHVYMAFGILRYKQHAYLDSQQLLQQALGIQVKLFPDDHPDIAATRLALGKTLIERHQLSEAQELLLKARDALSGAYGPASEDVKEALAALDRLHTLRGAS